jgi:DNA-binding transcriptional ArsR family regulator
MAEDKITLDREAFRTLASGTRVDILKSLDRRRKTLSELAKQFSMSVSTVKEHLDTLVKAGLIEQKDDGHKWKYYDLTRKGKSVLHPEDARVWIILGVSAIAMVGTMYSMLNESIFSPLQMFSAASERSSAPAPMLMGAAKDTVTAASSAPGLPWMHIAGLAVFGVILSLCVGYIIMSRRRAQNLF